MLGIILGTYIVGTLINIIYLSIYKVEIRKVIKEVYDEEPAYNIVMSLDQFSKIVCFFTVFMSWITICYLILGLIKK